MKLALTLGPRLLSVLTAVILAIVPFHAFLTIWLASGVGHYTALRLWKEVLLLGLSVAAVTLICKKRQVWSAFWSNRLVMLIATYGALLVGSALLGMATGDTTPKAAAYGLLSDSRYLLFMLTVAVFAWQSPWLRDHWKQLVLIPAVIVAAIALLQVTVLPHDILRHFGYSPETIPVTTTVDNKSEYVRAAATLRGANPLGAFLVVAVTAAGVLWVKTKRRLYLVVVLLCAAALVTSLSRSAWLGLLASACTAVWVLAESTALRRRLLLGTLAGLFLFAGTLFTLRNNDHVQNVFFHSDEHSTSSVSSNSARASAMGQGLRDIVGRPFGSGVGSAGPASVYNGDKPARISENYFVQIGQEVGIIGLGLFVAINAIVFRWLQRNRDDVLGIVLAASLVGLTVVNFLSHAWADDTLAYVWWGLAGIALNRNLLPEKMIKKTQGLKHKKRGEL